MVESSSIRAEMHGDAGSGALCGGAGARGGALRGSARGRGVEAGAWGGEVRASRRGWGRSKCGSGKHKVSASNPALTGGALA